MRWQILKTLLHKEALRHATNRGGLALAGLMVTASLLLAVLNPAGEKDKPASLVGGIHHCLVYYEDETEWVAHLKQSVPTSLTYNVLFRHIDRPMDPEDRIKYSTGAGGIEIRTLPAQANAAHQYKVWVRYPEGDRTGMAAYESWFWRESHKFFHAQAAKKLQQAGIEPTPKFALPDLDDDLWAQRRAYSELQTQYENSAGGVPSPLPVLNFKETAVIGGGLDLRAAIATALVMFSLCFTCVYLMPSLTCEERERGLLLAQALSPATAMEILAAKFLFYPAFGILLATLLAGIHNPAVLTRPFFWMLLLTLSVGTLGIGMTIACLAKTQRAASLGALCYMLVIALVLLLCQQYNIGFIPPLALEFHAPRILHATLTDQLRDEHWLNLAACAILATGWAALAVVLFRRRGWQ